MFLKLLVTGIIVGIVSAFFGVGGGVVIVPALYSLFPQFSPSQAIGTSLAVICLNSALNHFNLLRLGKRPELRLLSYLSIFLLIGVLIGAKLTTSLTQAQVKLGFAIIITIVAVRNLLFKLNKHIQSDWKPELEPKICFMIMVSALLAGIISGFTGLGGGVVLVPILLTVLHMPYNWIPAYTNLPMSLGTFAGILSYSLKPADTMGPFEWHNPISWQYGSVNWGLAVFILIASIPSARLGLHLSSRCKPQIAQYLFSLLLLAIATNIFLSL